MGSFRFRILKESTRSRARVGVIETKSGSIKTPAFVPVGTNGVIKSTDPLMADSYGACADQLMFANTYHLILQPGTKVIEKFGGIHKFMNRKRGPIITDSGGFQVFSMYAGSLDLDEKVQLKGAGSKSRPNLVEKVSEEGVIFKSYRDGSRVKLTPESSIIAQKEIGADIIIPLDELVPFNASQKQLEQSVERSHRWEKRSLEQHLSDKRDQAIYSVIHGGMDFELRAKSIEYLTKTLEGFDGHAIGGSLGKTRDDLGRLLDFISPKLPKDKPIHLLGIADMESIQRGVPLGIDTFDSCYPTRAARHGHALQGRFEKPISMRKGKFKMDQGPLLKNCECFTCQNYSRGYIHHLLKAHEPTYATLMTIHNLWQMHHMMNEIRVDIEENRI